MHVKHQPASLSDDGKRTDDALALVAEFTRFVYTEHNARREAASRGFVLTGDGETIEIREAHRPSIVRAGLDASEITGMLHEASITPGVVA